MGIEILDSSLIDEATWESYLQLDAGEERSYVQTRSGTRKSTVERESHDSLNASLEVSILEDLTAKLDSTLEQVSKRSTELELSASESFERKVSLPAEPSDMSQVYVKSRHLSRTPIFVRFRALVAKQCACCGKVTVLPLIIRRYSGFYATRHEDHLSDGRVNFVDTGKVRV